MTVRVLILGLGNPMMGDDGVGVAVVDLLVGAGYPAGVRAVAAPDVFALPQVWSSEKNVWLVDAMMRDSAPATIHRLSHEEIFALPPHATSAHHLALGEGLRWICHTFPKMVALSFRLWGVEPASITQGEGLSDTVAKAARIVSDEMLRTLVESRQISCD
jgi:hydrogenase maturation protease